MFQYSFCSYSTLTCTVNALFFYGFNTASVLIQRGEILNKTFYERRFNTASVLIQLHIRNRIILIRMVSIQLLFLFNEEVNPY